MTELTGEQAKVYRLAKAFEEPPVKDPVLRYIAQGLKERFSIGRYITRPDIRGGVGDSLVIKLGKVVLNDHLPPGVEYRGYRHVKEDDGTDYSSTSLHFYHMVRRHIGLVVECEPGAPYKLPIRATPVAGLIILHETGHSWDDYLHPQNRVLRIQNSLPSAILGKVTDGDAKEWYLRAQAGERSLNGHSNPELIRLLLQESLVAQARRVARDLTYNENGIASLVSPAQFTELTEEIGQKVAQEVLANYDSSRSYEGFMQAVETVRTLNKLAKEKFLRKYIQGQEVRAWDWLEEIEKRLKQIDPRISLWDGNEKSLLLLKAYFILHHPEVKLRDFPEGEVKRLLQGIADIDKIYE